MTSNGRKFRGRKLIINWDKLKLEISKLPYVGGVKDPNFELFYTDVLLANVYENENSQLEDEILGPPSGINGNVEGYHADIYVSDDRFWCTPGESLKEIKEY